MLSMNFKKHGWITLAVVLWVWFPENILAQDFLDLRIPKFEVKEATMEDALKKLLTWGVQVCLEKAPGVINEGGRPITLKMRNASIRDILDALTRDRGYYWERYRSVLDSRETNIINVLPLGAKEDKSNLMNIRSKMVKLDAEPFEAISYIKRFVPELRDELMKKFPGGFVGSEIKVIGAPRMRRYYVHLILEDVTVRQVLNEIALRSGGICWIYVSHPSYQWKPFF